MTIKRLNKMDQNMERVSSFLYVLRPMHHAPHSTLSASIKPFISFGMGDSNRIHCSEAG